MPKSSPAPISIRNRVTEMRMMRADELCEHPQQFRTHPPMQRDVLSSILAEIGVADALLAYYSTRNENALTLFDGHLRKSLDPLAMWPVLITDLNDDEADMMLAMLDKTSELAGSDPLMLNELLANVQPENETLQSFISDYLLPESTFDDLVTSAETERTVMSYQIVIDETDRERVDEIMRAVKKQFALTPRLKTISKPKIKNTRDVRVKNDDDDLDDDEYNDDAIDDELDLNDEQ